MERSTVGRTRSPAAFHYGPGHRIVHGNPPFLETFGEEVVGQPAREAMIGLPNEAFELMDLVFREGRALARRLRLADGDRRLVVAPRRDPETGETYGVTTYLRPIEAEQEPPGGD